MSGRPLTGLVRSRYAAFYRPSGSDDPWCRRNPEWATRPVAKHVYWPVILRGQLEGQPW